MVLTKAKKQSIVEKLTSALGGANILVFVNFHGLSVSKATRLRRALRQAGAHYTVVKKTLMKRALDSFGYSDIPKFEGEVGLVVGSSVSGSDVTEAPRIIAQCIKETKEGLAILGGVYESKFVGSDIIKRLASIPPRDILLAQLAFILTQPAASFARVLSEVVKKVE